MLFLYGALALVLLLTAWLLLGRRGSKRPQPTPRAFSPDDDEDFLRELRRRAEEQRRRAQDPRED